MIFEQKEQYIFTVRVKLSEYEISDIKELYSLGGIATTVKWFRKAYPSLGIREAKEIIEDIIR